MENKDIIDEIVINTINDLEKMQDTFNTDITNIGFELKEV